MIPNRRIPRKKYSDIFSIFESEGCWALCCAAVGFIMGAVVCSAFWIVLGGR